MTNTKQDFTSLLEVVPNASTQDITSLIGDINSIYEGETHQLEDSDNWMPSRHTVLELLKLNVKTKDLAFCIEDFKQFAINKEWTVNDNLDAKLITHVKILSQNKRISLAIPE